MPTIYDNIETNLIDGLTAMLEDARRADFCVGYFNLRGWEVLGRSIDGLSGENGDFCRLLVGMAQDPDDKARRIYNNDIQDITQNDVIQQKQRMAKVFAKQLTYGTPTNKDENSLRQLAKQLRKRQLKVKLYTRHPLHAKLYLAHRKDNIAALAGFVGSSNLTFSGLSKNGELNVDVIEQDAANKLSEWFNERWDDEWSLDINDELINIIEESWAGGPISPYHIYIKTAWHLSREAIQEAGQLRLPPDLAKKLLEHQLQAVSLAAQRLNQRRGVIIGDVVGLGKTLIATAVAKVFQEDQGDNVLVICPPALQENWKSHFHAYRIANEILSLGKVNQLENMRRYKLVILDESHNLRNRKSSRHKRVRDYIHHNDARVIMLTATPYNKSYEDIASQLLLFLDSGEDLGISPYEMLNKGDGITSFSAKHPNICPSSLSAFEQSSYIDDWRELMSLFMVRRTRTHIKDNYAEFDEDKKRYFLTFSTGERFYFPHREPRRLNFTLNDNTSDDQYAKLYSETVVNIIKKLELPRYGLTQHLKKNIKEIVAKEDKKLIDNLSRAGQRLRGFARAGLFKRLESSGESFLLSLKRHIKRNAMIAVAITKDEDFPIGQVMPSFIDDDTEEGKSILLDSEHNKDHTWSDYLATSELLLNDIRQNYDKDFDWIKCKYFKESLIENLQSDSEDLIKILNIVPHWDAGKDRKLESLRTLCTQTHKTEKLLIFTQYKDTAEYLYRHLKNDIDSINVVHGDTENIQDMINHFSPRANEASVLPKDELRVLIATDRLSEGVNLQDAHIIANYDLPWAIIRLTQRVGRVDRIGQRAETIYCYSAMPEDGIERIIELRGRLRRRMKQNNELIGSDEKFFEGEEENAMHRLYANDISLEDEEDETDLISRAHEIWRRAIKKDPKLEKVIKKLPDVVYSAKASDTKGVIAYIKDSRNHHVLAHIDNEKIVSQSQYKILDLMACDSEEYTKQIQDNHHEQVATVVKECQKNSLSLGGQLGGEGNTRRRVYERLKSILNNQDNQLFSKIDNSQDIKTVMQDIYNWPLRNISRDRLGRQLRAHITDNDLVDMVLNLYQKSDLCEIPKNNNEKPETKIICSLGLE